MDRQFLARRLLTARPLSKPRCRRLLFSRSNASIPGVRPSNPFLAPPSTRRLSFGTPTPTPQTQAGRILLGVCTGIGTIACMWSIQFLIEEEIKERIYVTPRDWDILTRLYLRAAKLAADSDVKTHATWQTIHDKCGDVIKRLEEGRQPDDKPTEEGPVYIEDIGKMGLDVSEESEQWRRGYFEAMMLLAQASENLEDFLMDKRRNVIVPPDQVIGPNYPKPRPVPAGGREHAREEDCAPAYDPPENTYLRIMTTRGFTHRQKMEAALAYASHLQFKQMEDAAEQMYGWALYLAVDSTDPRLLPVPLNRDNFVLLDDAGRVSGNVLTVLTEMARFKGSSGDVAGAFPMLISLLRSRKSLLEPAPTPTPPPTKPQSVLEKVKSLMSEPPYPAPRPDGSLPPTRDARSLCEEAGLAANIGEILFASTSKREDGVAWTRDAVDTAEEQLRALPPTDDAEHNEARKVCRECLLASITNWGRMVTMLRAEEEERERDPAPAVAPSRFQFWGSSAAQEELMRGRWGQEMDVVEARKRRTGDLMENFKPPTPTIESLFMKIFQA